jgi:hypothetical protein
MTGRWRGGAEQGSAGARVDEGGLGQVDDEPGAPGLREVGLSLLTPMGET